MIPLKFGTFQDEDPAGPDFVKDIPVDLFEGLSSAFEQGQRNTFFGGTGGFARIQALRAIGHDIDEDVTGGGFLKSLFDTLEAANIIDPIDKTPRKELSPEEATAQFGIEGELAFDKPISTSAAIFLRDEKKEELARRLVAERVKGFGSNFATLGAEFLGELSDPLGVGFLLFPNIAVVRGGKFLTQSARSTAAAGAGEGALGTIGALGLGALAGEQTKSDFDAYNGAITVLFGAGFGAGARVGLEKLAKTFAGRIAAKAPEAEYKGVSPEADEAAAKSALAQIVNDEKVTAPADIIRVDKASRLTEIPEDVKITRLAEGESQLYVDPDTELARGVQRVSVTMSEMKSKIRALRKGLNDPEFRKKLINEASDDPEVRAQLEKDFDRKARKHIKTLQNLVKKGPKTTSVPISEIKVPDTSIDDLIQVVATHIGKVEGGSVPAGIRDEIADAFAKAGIPLGTFDNFADNASAVRRLLAADISDPNIVKKTLRKILGTEGLEGPTVKAQALTRAESRAVNPPKERFDEDIPLETQRIESQDALDQVGNVNIEDFESLQTHRKALDSEIDESFNDLGFDEDQIAEIKRRTEEEYDAIDDERDAGLDTLDCIDKNTP